MCSRDKDLGRLPFGVRLPLSFQGDFMVQSKRHMVPPLSVMQLTDSSVDGDEGPIWEAIIGMRIGAQIVPAIRVNERGTGACIDMGQVDAGVQSREVFEKAMVLLLNYAERDRKREKEDTPALGWREQLVVEIVTHHEQGHEFHFKPIRFAAEPIPLKERRCRCGVVIDRTKNPHDRQCSRLCREREQFTLRLEASDKHVKDFKAIPLPNHVPSGGIRDVLLRIQVAEEAGAWPQDEKGKTLLTGAKLNLNEALHSLKRAKQILAKLHGRELDKWEEDC